MSDTETTENGTETTETQSRLAQFTKGQEDRQEPTPELPRQVSEPSDVSAHRNSRKEYDAELQEWESARVSQLEGAERAEAFNARQFDRGVIRDSVETDQYLRDGNVLFPPPLERPAGFRPSQTDGVVEFLQVTDEVNRGVR